MHFRKLNQNIGQPVRRLSVVTVCLNCADTILLTLENVRSQTYLDVEHIVIDGGSVDGTADIVRRFGVDYFVSESDGGIYHAMNKGIAASTGDVLVFLNSADVFYDNRVVADVITYFNETGSAIVFGDFVPYLVNPDDTYEHPHFEADVVCSNASVTNRTCLRDRNIHHQAVFYRREVFGTCSFFSKELPHGNDYELNAQALARDGYPASYISRAVTKFALGGVTTTDAEKEKRDYEDVINIIRHKYFPLAAEVPENEYIYQPPTANPTTKSLWNRICKRIPLVGQRRIAHRHRKNVAVLAQANDLVETGLMLEKRDLDRVVLPLQNKLQMLERENLDQRAALENLQKSLAKIHYKLDDLGARTAQNQMSLNHLNHQHERNSVAMLVTQSRLLENSLDAAGCRSPRERGYGLTSQFDEDGLIQFLVRNIDISNKTFVEFGVENYREANTRLLLRNENWRGLVMDSSEQDIQQIQKSDLYWRHNLQAKSAFITSNNINDLIASAGITGDIGLLSIDIDGVDYWVWEAISVIEPRIVVCEYNSIFGMSAKVTVPNERDFDRRRRHYSWLYAGASLAALTDLAQRKGYSLVASNCAGNNAFFVRNDVLGKLETLPVSDAYVKAQFRESRNEAGKLSYLTIEQGIQLLGDLPVVETDTGRTVLIKDIVCQYEAPRSLRSVSVA